MADNFTSKQFYRYLCHKIGSEKEVQFRREFFKVKDISDNHKDLNLEYISSGSKAEGLDIQGSDFDIMTMDKLNVVHTEYPCSKLSEKQDFTLLMDSTKPGFTKIIVVPPLWSRVCHFIRILGFAIDLCFTDRQLILRNVCFKTFAMKMFSRKVQQNIVEASDLLEVHGPCTSTKDKSVDEVFCFRVDKWPNAALEWISRPRSHNWPSKDLIEEIRDEEKSVLLVTIGSKFGTEEDNQHEWRISFSVAELMLVHSFNHTQLLCYALLKILLKEVIDKEAKNLLCSYFMKTLLFWLIEETGVAMWAPENLMKCFQACVTKLLYCVKLGYFPNYFIRQNYMFLSKHFEKEKICAILEDILLEGIHFALRIDTLKDFFSHTNNQMYTEINLKYHPEDKAVYPLMRYQFKPSFDSYLFCSLEKLHRYLTAINSNVVKSLFYMHFTRRCLDIACDTSYDLSGSNKHCYHQYRSIMPYLVIGSNCNLNGWLPLAAFLYQHKQFQEALKVIEFVCSEMDKKLNIIIPLAMQRGPFTFCEKGSFLERYKLLCTGPLIIDFKVASVFGQFCQDIPYMSNSYGNTDSLILDDSLHKIGYYMRFMCYHFMHNLPGKRKALFDFQKSIDNTDITIDTAYYLLWPLICYFEFCDISNTEYSCNNLEKYLEACKLSLDHPNFKTVVAKRVALDIEEALLSQFRSVKKRKTKQQKSNQSNKKQKKCNSRS